MRKPDGFDLICAQFLLVGLIAAVAWYAVRLEALESRAPCACEAGR